MSKRGGGGLGIGGGGAGTDAVAWRVFSLSQVVFPRL